MDKNQGRRNHKANETFVLGPQEFHFIFFYIFNIFCQFKLLSGKFC